MPQVETVSEWVEKRDAKGRLLFLYSPLRDAIRLRTKDGETEVNLSELRVQSFYAILRDVAATKR